ncbi:hypothetical protein [Psychrobacillus vulpis]|uniref:Uncharacterized protein n=1 Tax=Psychrobacillus vulpis TaxID=2325572 RepID=A0A544TTC9_9BACI|nr:hypothetical protein [Psychrobacillus vulpis]TQR20694.1 hypothetical protein FG384_06265 [Psychrobacillus vulpis]
MIKSFQLLFKGRVSTDKLQTVEDIRKFVVSELLDELTHPRARQSIHKKYEIAVNRITQSDLSDMDQQKLITIYREEYMKLSTVDET